MSAKPLRLALVALLLAACGSTTTFRMVIGPAGPAHRRDVQVFLTSMPLPSDYVEVAVVEAIGRGDQADVAHVMEGLRVEAATLGCDAVIHAQVDQGSTLVVGTAVAVRWRTGVPPPDVRAATRAPWSAPTSVSTAPTRAPPTPGVTTAPAPWAATAP